MPVHFAATGLCHVFFETFHHTFPFFDKDQLLENIAAFYNTGSDIVSFQRVWLAMANMVFCIGSNCLYLRGSAEQVGANDHLLY